MQWRQPVETSQRTRRSYASNRWSDTDTFCFFCRLGDRALVQDPVLGKLTSVAINAGVKIRSHCRHDMVYVELEGSRALLDQHTPLIRDRALELTKLFPGRPWTSSSTTTSTTTTATSTTAEKTVPVSTVHTHTPVSLPHTASDALDQLAQVALGWSDLPTHSSSSSSLLPVTMDVSRQEDKSVSKSQQVDGGQATGEPNPQKTGQEKADHCLHVLAKSDHVQLERILNPPASLPERVAPMPLSMDVRNTASTHPTPTTVKETDAAQKPQAVTLVETTTQSLTTARQEKRESKREPPIVIDDDDDKEDDPDLQILTPTRYHTHKKSSLSHTALQSMPWPDLQPAHRMPPLPTPQSLYTLSPRLLQWLQLQPQRRAKASAETDWQLVSGPRRFGNPLSQWQARFTATQWTGRFPADLEMFVIPADDPRVHLRGQPGCRVTRDFASGEFIALVGGWMGLRSELPDILGGLDQVAFEKTAVYFVHDWNNHPWQHRDKLVCASYGQCGDMAMRCIRDCRDQPRLDASRIPVSDKEERQCNVEYGEVLTNAFSAPWNTDGWLPVKFLFTRRAIKKGEEIRCEYGDYWRMVHQADQREMQWLNRNMQTDSDLLLALLKARVCA